MTKIRKTIRGYKRRRLHVVGFRHGGRRYRPSTALLVSLATGERAVRVPKGGALPIWLSRAQVVALRGVLDRIIGDRPVITHETLRKIGIKVEDCKPAKRARP